MTSERNFHVEGDILRLIDTESGLTQDVEVLARERASFVHRWSEYVAPGAENGPEEITNIEPAEDNKELYQGVFGVREGMKIYVDFPSNIRLGGFPTFPKPTSSNRDVGHIDNIQSPFDNPDMETEFFLRGNTSKSKISLSVFNSSGVAMQPKIQFFINKMVIKEVTNAEKIAKIRLGEIIPRPITIGAIPSTRGEIMRG